MKAGILAQLISARQLAETTATLLKLIPVADGIDPKDCQVLAAELHEKVRALTSEAQREGRTERVHIRAIDHKGIVGYFFIGPEPKDETDAKEMNRLGNLGYGGRPFEVTWLDGSKTITHNLWAGSENVNAVQVAGIVRVKSSEVAA